MCEGFADKGPPGDMSENLWVVLLTKAYSVCVCDVNEYSSFQPKNRILLVFTKCIFLVLFLLLLIGTVVTMIFAPPHSVPKETVKPGQ